MAAHRSVLLVLLLLLLLLVLVLPPLLPRRHPTLSSRSASSCILSYSLPQRRFKSPNKGLRLSGKPDPPFHALEQCRCAQGSVARESVRLSSRFDASSG
eukprot:768607-Hanusia_phi.AAC.14